ncbi:MAG: DUF4097 family beta strand repeat protein [Anaerolineaceae bacterium]|nr:DUF4097 family beta strand repeat protein [Anaerolineaceae bacterium]
MESKSLFMLLLLGGIVVMGIFAMNILPLTDINQERTFQVDEIEQINVDVTIYPVHVIRTTAGSEIKFHLYGRSSEDTELIADLHQGTVDVEIRHKYRVHLPDRLYLDIYLPEDYEKSLDINITTGSVELDDLDLTAFRLNTTTGGMKADHLNADDVSIRTTTGSIRINQLTANNLEIRGSTSGVSIDECVVETGVIKTTTGAIHVPEAKGDFNIEASTGRVTFAMNTLQEHTIRIKTTTGAIQVNDGSGDFDLEASTGSVKLSMAAFQENNVRIKTTTGGITLQLPEDAEFSLQAENTTGSINSDFPIQKISEHKVTGEIGAASGSVTLKASTGSINLLKK